jgi:pyruvate/2-oxoglutarate dehydrogenase complex dihydrolipoamide acyltransferase (E2) component
LAEPVTIEAMHGANFARVVAVPVASGESVSAGQTLCEVENHKIVQEIASPAGGVAVHALLIGALVRLETPIAFIAAAGDDQAGLRAQAVQGLAPSDTVWTDLVCPVLSPARPAGKPISIAKATEIAVLSGGAANSLQATLGAAIGPIQRGEGTAGFFADKVLDLIVYEASRLLVTRKFRALNSRFADGAVIARDRVSAGVSFDEGGRLTLYAIPDTDQLDLPQTQDALVEGLMRYVGKRLTLADVATSTFTISDVTTTDLNLSVPLLPRDQCIIIVVIRDGAGGFSLAISYDHRITEGLVVANFATELVKRVRAYSVPPVLAEPAGALAPVCSFCERPVTEEVEQFRRRGLIRMIDARGEDALCCSSCWEGW